MNMISQRFPFVIRQGFRFNFRTLGADFIGIMMTGCQCTPSIDTHLGAGGILMTQYDISIEHATSTSAVFRVIARGNGTKFGPFRPTFFARMMGPRLPAFTNF